MANRLQFGLPALFALTTGLAVALGLIRWNATVGSLLSITLVGGGWSWGACRSGHRRLAYFLMTPVLGVVAYLVLSLPLTPATFFVLWGFSGTWPRLSEMLCMCAASSLTAWLLRRRIRRPVTGNGGATAAMAAYLGTLAYGWAFLAGCAFRYAVGVDVAGFVAMAIIMLLICPVITTFSLHIAWPMAFLFVRLLREVDPLERELNDSEREVVEGLRALARRPLGRYHRLNHDDVAEHLDRESADVRRDLERLVQLRAIDDSPLYGYRLFS